MASSNAQFILTDTSGTERGLAEKMFETEVLMAFRQSTLFYDLRNTFVQIKQIAGVGSADFPMVGFDPEPEDHVPGDELLGQTQAFTQFNIAPDDFVVGHRFVAGDDQMLAHFDAAKPYAMGIGHQLAVSVDRRISWMAVKAARTSALTDFHNGGNIVSRTGGGTTIADAYPESATGAGYILADARTLARKMDEDEVPEQGRALVLSAYGRSVLQYDTSGALFSRDYQNGENSINDRRVGRMAGFDLYVSNNSLPSTNITNKGPRSSRTKYDIDCRYLAGNVAAGTGQPLALAFCGASEGKAALGMTIAENFYTHKRYIPERGGWFMMGRNFLGVGKLNVWCAGEIRAQLS